MPPKEDKDKRARARQRNLAAKSLRNFKPQKIENKKKRLRYEPEDDEEDDVSEYIR